MHYKVVTTSCLKYPSFGHKLYSILTMNIPEQYFSYGNIPVVCWVDFYFTDYTDYWTKAILSFFLSFFFALLQMMSCSTSTVGVSAWCWELWECALPNLPTGPGDALLSQTVSPCQPDHTVLVTTVRTLPTGYNYSAFYHSSFTPPPTLSWVLTLRSRRKAAGPLLCVHSVLNGSRWTGAQNRWEGCWYNRGIGRDPSGPEWGWGEGGRGGLLASNPPTCFCHFYFSLSASYIFFFHPPSPVLHSSATANSVCQRLGASELPTKKMDGSE